MDAWFPTVGDMHSCIAFVLYHLFFFLSNIASSHSTSETTDYPTESWMIESGIPSQLNLQYTSSLTESSEQVIRSLKTTCSLAICALDLLLLPRILLRHLSAPSPLLASLYANSMMSKLQDLKGWAARGRK